MIGVETFFVRHTFGGFGGRRFSGFRIGKFSTAKKTVDIFESLKPYEGFRDFWPCGLYVSHGCLGFRFRGFFHVHGAKKSVILGGGLKDFDP